MIKIGMKNLMCEGLKTPTHTKKALKAIPVKYDFILFRFIDLLVGKNVGIMAQICLETNVLLCHVRIKSHDVPQLGQRTVDFLVG